MKIRSASNVSRTVKRAHIRTAANVSRLWKLIHIRDASNVSREASGFVDPMEPIADPDSVFGSTSAPYPQAVYTSYTTVTVTGGIPPYSYSWAVDAGWTASNPTGAATAFLSPDINPSDSGNANAVCTVTDSTPGTPQVAGSNGVSAFVTNYGV